MAFIWIICCFWILMFLGLALYFSFKFVVFKLSSWEPPKESCPLEHALGERLPCQWYSVNPGNTIFYRNQDNVLEGIRCTTYLTQPTPHTQGHKFLYKPSAKIKFTQSLKLNILILIEPYHIEQNKAFNLYFSY